MDTKELLYFEVYFVDGNDQTSPASYLCPYYSISEETFDELREFFEYFSHDMNEYKLMKTAYTRDEADSLMSQNQFFEARDIPYVIRVCTKEIVTDELLERFMRYHYDDLNEEKFHDWWWSNAVYTSLSFETPELHDNNDHE